MAYVTCVLGGGGLEPQCWPNRWAQESMLVGAPWAPGNNLVGASGAQCPAELPGTHSPLRTGQARLPVELCPLRPLQRRRPGYSQSARLWLCCDRLPTTRASDGRCHPSPLRAALPLHTSSGGPVHIWQLSLSCHPSDHLPTGCHGLSPQCLEEPARGSGHEQLSQAPLVTPLWVAQVQGMGALLRAGGGSAAVPGLVSALAVLS